jgi:hypothetical protein
MPGSLRRDQVASRPIQYHSGDTLLPGKYIIKVLARDTMTGRIGTDQTTFTVPNLVREQKQLPISSVVLSNQRVSAGDEAFSVERRGVAAIDPLVHGNEKLVPSVTRVFSVARDMEVFIQGYERGSTTMWPLVRLLARAGGARTVSRSTAYCEAGVDVAGPIPTISRTHSTSFAPS